MQRVLVERAETDHLIACYESELIIDGPGDINLRLRGECNLVMVGDSLHVQPVGYDQLALGAHIIASEGLELMIIVFLVGPVLFDYLVSLLPLPCIALI